MEQLLKTWKLRMVKYRQEADNANTPITRVKAMNKFFIIRDCIKELEEQLTIPVVGVTLPNIDEINKVLKNQLEDLEYREKLDGYEMTAYRRGFTYCLKWLGNKLTKGN